MGRPCRRPRPRRGRIRGSRGAKSGRDTPRGGVRPACRESRDSEARRARARTRSRCRERRRWSGRWPADPIERGIPRGASAGPRSRSPRRSRDRFRAPGRAPVARSSPSSRSVRTRRPRRRRSRIAPSSGARRLRPGDRRACRPDRRGAPAGTARVRAWAREPSSRAACAASALPRGETYARVLPMAHADLDALREQIRKLDEEIVARAAERVELARRVGELKRAQALPTVDFGQERLVLERARAAALERGLAPEVAEDMLAQLIRASVIAQDMDRLRHAAVGAGRKAVVVGGAGRMGRWLTKFLAAQGFDVGILDPAASEGENAWSADALRTADFVICATPPAATAALYREW